MKHILDVSCEVEARGSDLGCEQSLLILQAVTHITLEGFLQGVISGVEAEDSHSDHKSERKKDDSKGKKM